ncbi:hypothetical protein HMPREF3145_00925 [Corynebacterium sp. HMSC05C01]|uniref:glycosyltransferase family 4 protein n=1 Tax=Corynebacterium sp. HMSC05C01 TaxID=1581113 RepID=UPI0008A107CA|nr:glycosyltransferase family 4 protein [Corynebacterium sp. HMSC05C01]OFT72734.1 hypothetical protein HMPREF3145_00925 [Corynebacterium sp. HMSC05C01]
MSTASLTNNPKVKVLVVCNAYPSEKALYRNGFIHRRTKAYVAAGIEVEVFYHHEPISQAYSYEYDGVFVTVGNSAALEAQAGNHEYDAFLVHFAEEHRVEPLLKQSNHRPIIIWIHGFEAEAWHRRWFNFFDSSEAIRSAISKKDTYYRPQLAYFHDLVEKNDPRVSFVNVSKWFEQHVVQPDLGVVFENSRVIHNLVDEEVFPYVEKTADQRKKILSIRPYASRKYANDQTVKAILELSRRPFFSDLSFTIAGQGKMFEDTTAPIASFSNVKLLNRFFDQEEIATLHSEHGVFLSPTRFDSQGVSMCEAASSGLVNLSTHVAAVPEFFTDHVDSLLAAPESHEDLADNIEELYFNPALFNRLSKAGSERMRRQCGVDATVNKEIDLIKEKVEG